MKSWKRWIAVVALAALPVALALVLRERASWRPRTLGWAHQADGRAGSLAWSPDGRLLARSSVQLGTVELPDWQQQVAQADAHIQMWDASAARLLWSVKLPGASGLQFSPDSSLLAADANGCVPNARDGIRVLDAREGTPRLRLAGKEPFSFEPGGASIVSGGFASWQRSAPNELPTLLWDVRSGRRTLGAPLQLAPNQACIRTESPDSLATIPASYVLGLGGRWGAGALLQKDPHDDNPDTWLDGGLLLFDTRRPGLRKLLFDVESAMLSRDRHWLAVHKRTASTGLSGEVLQMWDMASGRLQREWALPDLSGPSGSERLLAASPDGSLLLSMSQNGDDLKAWRSEEGAMFEQRGLVRAWDARAGRLLSVWSGKGLFRMVALSADGSLAAVASDDEQSIVLRQARSGQVVRELHGSAGCINALAFSPGGNTLASAADDGTVKLWRVK